MVARSDPGHLASILFAPSLARAQLSVLLSALNLHQISHTLVETTICGGGAVRSGICVGPHKEQLEGWFGI